MKELGYILKPSKLSEFFKSVLKLDDNSYWFNLPSRFFESLGIDSYDIEFEFMINSDNRIVLVGPRVNHTGPTTNHIPNEITNLV